MFDYIKQEIFFKDCKIYGPWDQGSQSHGYIDHIVEFLDEYLENDLDLNG